MKRIMLLGGSRYLLPVIQAAHSLDIEVITADYLPDNYAHKFSDDYCNVSIVEKELVMREAEKRKIDGIMSFACDPGVVTAAYVAQVMNLPSPGPYESIQILQNKGKFRKFLAEHGFHVPASITLSDTQNARDQLRFFQWPLIVKPTDAAGSKGVTKVYEPKYLEMAIKYALSYSRSKEVIVEEFLQQVGYSSDSDCFSIDGNLVYASFNNQLFDAKAQNPFTPAAFGWPTSMSDEHQDELRSELQRLLSLLHLRTSIFNVETRLSTNGKTYIMECSPRGGGNRLAEVIRMATGTDLIVNAVRASVGLACENIRETPSDGAWAEIILHGSRSGSYQGLWIAEEIKDRVVQIDEWVALGDSIGAFSAANESIGTLILHFQTREEMEEVLSNQDEYIRICVR